MSLEDLESHIDNQNGKIQKLIQNGYFSALEPRFLGWERFRESLWGKGLEHLRAETFEAQEIADEPTPEVDMDDGSLSDIEMDDEPPSSAAATVVKIPEAILDVWGLDSPWVLVRSEYEEASRAALSANTEYDDVLIITGQPGIGPPLSDRKSVV